MIKKLQNCISLSILHTYFSNNECDVLSLTPIKESKREMKQLDLLLNPDINQFSIFAAYNATQGFSWQKLTNVVDELYFFVLNSDNNFLNYTNVPLVIDNKTYYFTNSKGSSGMQKGKQVAAADRVNLTDLQFNIDIPKNPSVVVTVKDAYGKTVINQTIDGTKQDTFIIDLMIFGSGYYKLYIAGKLNQSFLAIAEMLPVNCLGVLRVDLKAITAEQSKNLPVNYQLNFQTRSTFWVYQVVISPNKKIEVESMTIQSKGGYTYSGPVQTPIVGGNTASVYTSTKVIPLQEQSSNTQTLKVIYRNPFSERKNEMDVPMPFPDVSSIQQQSGKKAVSYVSNKIIYV